LNRFFGRGCHPDISTRQTHRRRTHYSSDAHHHSGSVFANSYLINPAGRRPACGL